MRKRPMTASPPMTIPAIGPGPSEDPDDGAFEAEESAGEVSLASFESAPVAFALVKMIVVTTPPASVLMLVIV